jgi:hypothetical protein
MLASPMVVQNKLTEQLINEVINVQNAIKGGTPTPPRTDLPMATGFKFGGPAADLSTNFYKNIDRARDNLTNRGNSVLNAPGIDRDNIVKRSENAVDISTANLATGPLLAELDRLSRDFYKVTEDLKTATQEQRPKLELAKLEIKDGMDKVSEAIRLGATGAREAGQSFANDFRQNFQDSLTGLLSGKSDGDKSVFRTFVDGFLNNFTSSVLSEFSKGATNSLFGSTTKGGEMMSSLGIGLFSLFGGKKTDSSGTPTSGAASGPGAGLGGTLGMDWDSIKNGFAEIFSGDGGLFSMIKSGFASLFDSGGSLFAGLGDSLSGIADSVISAFSSIDWGAIMKFFFSDGGRVSGSGTGTSDSIPAMLSNGEYVINAASTKKYGRLIEAINSGTLRGLATGGLVSTAMIATPTMTSVNMDGGRGSRNQQIINLTITGDISRQTKAEIFQMLPSIAEGVNSHNKERGYRG